MTTPLIKEFNIEDSTLAQFGISGPRIQTVQIADSSYNVLDDLAANTGSTGVGTYIVVTGSGFDTSSIVIIGSSNLNTISYTQANSTTFVSSTQLRALIPPKAAGFYNLYVQNGDGTTAVRINGIQYSDFPVWNFGSLILKPKIINYPFVENFGSATQSNTIIYSVANGSTLPANTTLLANGYYYGIPNTSGTYSNLYLDVKDAENQNTSQYIIEEFNTGDSNYFKTSMHVVGMERPNYSSDLSPSRHSFKPFGDTKPAAFHPFGDNWSYYFDGTGDYLTIPDSDFLNFLNLDFSVECWFFSASTPGTVDLITKRATAATFAGIRLGFTGTLFPQFQATIGAVAWDVSLTSSTAIVLGRFNHIACTRVGNVWTIYVNGVVGATATLAGTIPRNTAVFSIGATAAGTQVIGSSLVADVRVQFRNSAYAGAFTPPTSKLQKTADTVLLTLQDNYVIDRSDRNFTITKLNDVAARPYGPYGDNTSYNNTARLGSTFFDQASDYILADPGNSTDFEFLTGDFTWECWVYYTGNYSQGSFYYDSNALADATGTGTLRIGQNTTTGALVVSTNNGTTLITGTQMPRNTWNHLLLSRNNNNLRLFLNGLQTGATSTAVVSFVTKPNRPVLGGTGQGFGSLMLGYLHGLRIIKGNALWTANTPPPTAPADVIANTVLLTMQTYDGENNKKLVDISKTGALTTYPSSQNGPVGSFSPFSPFSYSGYFDGSLTSPDYISIAANTNLTLSNYDHSLEFWMFPRGDQNGFATIWSYSGIGNPKTSTDTYYMRMGLSSIVLWVANTNISVGQYRESLNTWSHFAITRTGNTFRVFKDGILRAHSNVNTTITPQVSPLYIGGDTQVVNQPWAGWISNFRVTINSVPTIYQTTETIAGTTVFTPPSSPLTVEANTQLLVLATNRFNDKSNNNFAVSRTGDNTKIVPFTPFKGSNVYQPHLHGASWFAQDASNFFTLAYNKELYDWWNTGSGVTVPYTIELWFYCTALPATSTIPHIIGNHPTGAGTSYWSFGIRILGNVVFHYNNGTPQYVISSQTVKVGEWNHLAVTITPGSGIRVWVNGVADPAVAISGTPTATLTTVPLSIGGYNAAAMLGYYSNLRIVKGDAIYTANSAPPTAPVTRTANTVLLMNFDTGGIIDYTTKHNILTIGDAKVWPAPSRLGGTYSPYRNKYSNTALFFDGVGDYLSIAAGASASSARSETENFYNGDWCIEFWVYRYGNVQQTIYDQRSATTQNSPLIYLTNTQNVRYYLNGFDRISTAAITSNTWVHVAVERYNNLVTIYLDGSRSGGTFLDANTHLANLNQIGASSSVGTPYTGYIQDFRITKGARYTANLTNEMYQSYPLG